jgi:alpha-tubulin suppressor-like RCC1 family protein
MKTSLVVLSMLVSAGLSACGTRTELLDARATETPGDSGTGGTSGAGGTGGTSGAAGSPDAGGPGYSQTQLALGSYHTCSVRYDGRVVCWGGNQQGQLGDGTNEARTTPVRVPLPAAAVQALTAGFRHTCAALVTGEVYCWGENTDGQVSPDGESIVTSPVRVPIDGLGFASVNGLAAGEYHTCAALADGRLICWGSNRQGQLGIGPSTADAPPREVPLPGPASQVSAGDFFTCAIVNAEGKNGVWCFGQNHYGQLGDGTNEDSSSPVRALLDDSVQWIDAGGFFVIASLQGEGYPPLYGWGENGSGQLGPDVGGATSVPTKITPSWNLVDWSAGLSHACAVRWHDEPPWETLCWGTNGQGQLGDGTLTSRAEPRAVKGDFEALVVEAGLLHTCAESLEGGAYCWGSNEFGQLGDGTTIDRTVPVQVSGL